LATHFQNVIFCLSAPELFQKSASKSLRLLYIYQKSSSNHTFLCKTKPILARPTMNLTLYLKRNYVKYSPLRTMKNKPKTNPIQSQFKANSRKPQNEPNPIQEKQLHKIYDLRPKKNEPNSNPKRTQFSAASPRLHAGGSTQSSNRGPIPRKQPAMSIASRH